MRLGLTPGTRFVLPPISLRVANFQTHLDLQRREELVERREARLVSLTRETDLLESRAVALDDRQQRIEDVEAALAERERQAGENERRLQAWEQHLTAQAQLLETGHQDSQRMQLEIVQSRRELDQRETVVTKREEACDDASRDCLNTHGQIQQRQQAIDTRTAHLDARDAALTQWKIDLGAWADRNIHQIVTTRELLNADIHRITDAVHLAKQRIRQHLAQLHPSTPSEHDQSSEAGGQNLMEELNAIGEDVLSRTNTSGCPSPSSIPPADATLSEAVHRHH